MIEFSLKSHSCQPVAVKSRAVQPLADKRAGERGGSRINLLIFLLLIAVVVYSISNYAPIAYEGQQFKDLMQQKVDQAAAFNHTGEWVSTQLRLAAPNYDVPPEAIVIANRRDGRMEAVVRYTRPVALPGFIYNYEFDHTVRSGNFFNQ